MEEREEIVMKKGSVKAFVCATVMALAMMVTACGGSKTLEEYLKSDADTQKMLDEQAAAQSTDELEMTIEVTGNDVICVATFKDFVELPDDVADTLNGAMDALDSAFSSIAGQLDDAIGAEKGTVAYIVKYCDSEGNVLAEKTFKAE